MLFPRAFLPGLIIVTSAFICLAGRVPQKYNEQPALGVWVNKQRMEFKPYLDDPNREMTLIISEKFRHLKDVGFEWAKPKGDQLWNEKYRELQQYRNYKGHCK